MSKLKQDQVRNLKYKLKEANEMSDKYLNDFYAQQRLSLKYRDISREILIEMGLHGSSINTKWIASKLSEMLK